MFRIGEEYQRQSLLDFVGSKQLLSGVIYGNKEPGCIIVTSGGKHGKEAGYSDIKNYDGSWQYIGQGAEGNQDPYSKINSLLTNGERTVLLFSTREPSYKESKIRGNKKKFYKYEGIFEVGSWGIIIPQEGHRAGNVLVQYHLLPADNIFMNNVNASNISIVNEPDTFYHLRDKLKNLDVKPVKTKVANIVEYRIRSLQIKKYALERAMGICEYCQNTAPFIDSNGIPFLEVHHIHKLADDGPDIPINVGAICPNCHREAHYGINKTRINEKLITIIKTKEDGLD